MKIKDIITEQHGGNGSLQPDVSKALPNAQGFPGLPNQDPYLQYRFGLAMAAAKAVQSGEIEFDTESAFSENLTVVARTEAEEEIVKLAQQLDPRGKRSKQISTRDSAESSDVNTKSPMVPKGPIKRH